MSCWPHPNTRPSASIAPLILTALVITLAATPAVAADTITAVSENGRTVYVNDEDSGPKQAAAREIPVEAFLRSCLLEQYRAHVEAGSGAHAIGV